MAIMNTDECIKIDKNIVLAELDYVERKLLSTSIYFHHAIRIDVKCSTSWIDRILSLD
jgi:hypothetical protein